MTGTSLKFLMMIVMVFDHIGYFISPELSSLFHLLSRPVAPVFAYFAVEGFIHTRNMEKYISRLFIAAFLMSAGNILINNYIIKDTNYFVHNNIFISLALGVGGLYVLENIYYKNKKTLGIIFMIILLGISIFTEGGIFIFPFILISYLERENIKKRDIIFIGLTIFFLITSMPDIVGSGNLKNDLIMFGFNSDILFFLAGLPFMHLYNGRRGLNNKLTKYIFYIFYPLHLWFIGILASRIL